MTATGCAGRFSLPSIGRPVTGSADEPIGHRPCRSDELYRPPGDGDLPLRYYPKDRLISAEDRARWVEPDLATLPEW